MGQDREIGQSGNTVTHDEPVKAAATLVTFPNGELSAEFFATELAGDKQLEWWLLIKELGVICLLVAFVLVRGWAFGY